jgi:uncharacterized protein (TIGR03000 family)
MSRFHLALSVGLSLAMTVPALAHGGGHGGHGGYGGFGHGGYGGFGYGGFHGFGFGGYRGFGYGGFGYGGFGLGGFGLGGLGLGGFGYGGLGYGGFGYGGLGFGGLGYGGFGYGGLGYGGFGYGGYGGYGYGGCECGNLYPIGYNGIGGSFPAANGSPLPGYVGNGPRYVDYYTRRAELTPGPALTANSSGRRGRYVDYYARTAEPGATTPNRYRTLAQIADNKALLRVHLPTDAILWLNGQRMTQTGAEREFLSPELEEGATYRYQVKARWQKDGHTVEQTIPVEVHANKTATVHFRTPPAPEKDSLPQPRVAGRDG